MLFQTVSPPQISHMMQEAEGDCVSSRLEVGALFLASTTPEQVLESACSQADASRLRGLAPDLDHIGFMAPIAAEPIVAAAATAAGFDRDHRTFPSTILARELRELRGRDVPTTIFKARGSLPDGAPRAVEVSMPRKLDAGVLADWIGRGIGAHIALRLAGATHFAEVTRIMRRQGFEVPAFMRRGPVANEAERIRALYFAHPARAETPRLEFFTSP